MAGAARFSEAEMNFTRLHILLRTYATEALRSFFDRVPDVKPNELNDSIRGWKERLLKQNNPDLNHKQKQLLGIHVNPPSGDAKSEKFDLMLMVLLLRRYAEIQPPSEGWDKMPKSTDVSKSADVARLKNYFEKYSNEDNAGFILFEEEWKDIVGGILRLIPPSEQENYTKKTNALKNLPMNMEDYNRIFTSHRYESKKFISEGMKPRDHQEAGVRFEDEPQYFDNEEGEEDEEGEAATHAHQPKRQLQLRMVYTDDIDRYIFDDSLHIENQIKVTLSAGITWVSNCIYRGHSTQCASLTVRSGRKVGQVALLYTGPDRQKYVKTSPKGKFMRFATLKSGNITFLQYPGKDEEEEKSLGGDSEEMLAEKKMQPGEISSKDQKDQYDDVGYTPLHWAARQTDKEKIRFWIESGADINAKSKRSGWGALHMCAMTNEQKGIAEMLLDNKADPNIETKSNWTPLHFAATSGLMKLAELLLNSGADVNHREAEGWTPLHMAAESGMDDMVELLLKYGADPNIEQVDSRIPLHYAAQHKRLVIVTTLVNKGTNVNKADNDGVTPVHLAAAIGGYPVVETLVLHGANLNCIENSLWTPLHFAAQGGDEETAQWLLENGADVNAKDDQEHTPLHYAAQNGKVGVTKALIKGKADLNIKGLSGETALYLAVANKHEDIATLLLDCDQDLRVADKYQTSLLHIAAFRGLLQTIKALIGKGIEIDVTEFEGRTALHFAAQQGNTEVVMYLIEHGAVAFASDNKCVTPLHLATSLGHIETVKVLLPYYENLDCVEVKCSWTPLLFAAIGGHTKIAELLVNHTHGADINFKDVKNLTPLHLAAYKGSVDFTKFLLQNGANLQMQDYHNRSAIHFATTEEIARLLMSSGLATKVKDTLGRSPLHSASQFAQTGLCQFYINKGADVRASDYNGFQPIHLAFRVSVKEICQLFIDAGASVHCMQKDRWQPLHFAARRGIAAAGELLIRCKADVNAVDKDGWSPLHISTYYGFLDFTKMLLGKGGNVNLCQNEGSTPLHLATKWGRKTIVETLIEHGAKIDIYDKKGRLPIHVAVAYKRKMTAEYLSVLHQAKGAKMKQPQHSVQQRGKTSPPRSGINPQKARASGPREKQELRRDTVVTGATKGDTNPDDSTREFFEGNSELFKSILMGAVDGDAKGKKDEIMKLLMELKKQKKGSQTGIEERKKQKKKVLALLKNALQNCDDEDEDKVDFNSNNNL